MANATVATAGESTSPQPDTPPASAPAPATTLSDAHLVAAAEACRWDTLRFGSCSFKLEEMQPWLDSVRARLFTRKASFMLSRRAAGDENLQQMCLLALKAALPVSKRSSFEHYTCFTDTFKALVSTCDAVKRATALSKQAQLTNISMKSSESLVSYLDRASVLWGSLLGSPQQIEESCAVDHTLRGLPSAHAWFLALATASDITTFFAASELAMRHSTSRVADTPEMHHFQGRGRGGYGRRSNPRQRGYQGNRPQCSQCQRHHFPHERCHPRGSGRGPAHPPGPRTSHNAPCPTTSSYHHTVGNAESCSAEFLHTETNSVAAAGVELCVDSGSTHVVTPDASCLSDYQSLPPSEGNIKLASADSNCSAVGYGTFTLR
jgi:hypothetical protein